MQIDDAKLRAILLRENYVSEVDLAKAEAFCREHHTPLTDYLQTAGLLTDQLFGQAIAESLEIPFEDLAAHPPPRDRVLRLPAAFVKQYRAILAEETDKQVVIATDSPTAEGLVETATSLFPKRRVVIAFALMGAINEQLIHFRKPLESRASKIIEEANTSRPRSSMPSSMMP